LRRCKDVRYLAGHPHEVLTVAAIVQHGVMGVQSSRRNGSRVHLCIIFQEIGICICKSIFLAESIEYNNLAIHLILVPDRDRDVMGGVSAAFHVSQRAHYFLMHVCQFSPRPNVSDPIYRLDAYQ